MTALSKLVALGIGTALTYLLIALAGQSLHVEGVGNWSLLAILALFAVAFAGYLAAMRVALHARQDRLLLYVIALFAILFRVTLLFTDPVAELDIYRYLWDGQACSHGVDPFRYSPAQVLALSDATPMSPDLAMLMTLRDASPEMLEIIQRIHFGELPTIYPPTSQAVFALASLMTPEHATVLHRMVIFKAWFVAFDLATFVFVVLLLRHLGKPIAWSLVYGWCPLLVKEVANSGHLDAVAMFFTALAGYLTVRACFPKQDRPTEQISAGSRTSTGPIWMVFASALALALAIGAKIYPLVLVPLFLMVAFRQLGGRTALGVAVVLLAVTGIVMWPMIPKDELAELPEFRISSVSDDLPPLPPPHIGTEARDPSESLRAFLGEWEMNDFIFLLLMENIRPTFALPPQEVAWFSVVPEAWRKPAREWTGKIAGVEPSRTPFVLSRVITSALFFVAALLLAWRAGKRATATAFLESAFLTIAWFWLILPTANPWYWTWVLPFLPFARSRVWLIMSGLVFLYYLRFWLDFHYPVPPVLGTRYNGAFFFDYNVTWIEFGPWFVALLITYGMYVKRCKAECDSALGK